MFDRRRTPRVFRWGFSSILVFASFRRTPRNSRDGLASPVIMCECAMEPIGPVWPQVAAIFWRLPAQPPLLASHTGSGLPCVRSDKRAAHLQGLADASYRGQDQPQQPFGAGKARKRGTLCTGYCGPLSDHRPTATSRTHSDHHRNLYLHISLSR